MARFRPIRLLKIAVKRVVVVLVRVVLRALPARLRVLVRENAGVVARLDYSAARILLHVDSQVEFGTRRLSCAKEPETVRWLESTLKPGDMLYDIGANVGAYSLVAAQQCRGRVRVAAFEPAATTYAQLCRNVVLNACTERVTPFPVALSERTGLSAFNYTDLAPGAALHTLDDPAIESRAFSPAYRQPVLVYRLDDFVDGCGVQPPTHIKIDVDGAELSVVRGAERTLQNSSLRTLLIELEEQTAEFVAVLSLLQTCGFRVDSRHRCVPGTSDPRLVLFHNYIFVR